MCGIRLDLLVNYLKSDDEISMGCVHFDHKIIESVQRSCMRVLLWLMFFSVLLNTALAQITVTGLADKQVYSDSVSFTVNSESGFDYTAELDGDPVAVDVSITVDQPEYYELYVHKQDQVTAAEESLLIQFIVRASTIQFVISAFQLTVISTCRICSY